LHTVIDGSQTWQVWSQDITSILHQAAWQLFHITAIHPMSYGSPLCSSWFRYHLPAGQPLAFWWNVPLLTCTCLPAYAHLCTANVHPWVFHPGPWPACSLNWLWCLSWTKSLLRFIPPSQTSPHPTPSVFPLALGGVFGLGWVVRWLVNSSIPPLPT
jgi:hypothetical protein